MAKTIKISKGLDINLKGKAQQRISGNLQSDLYSIDPDDFTGITAKVNVKTGDKVLAGSVILYDKNKPAVKIVSPVSGEVVAINRGEKRKLLSIDILPEKVNQYVEFGKADPAGLLKTEIKEKLSEAGILPFIKQRPYDIIADPETNPRDIFITGFNSAPLAADNNFILTGNETDFQAGLTAISKLTTGKVYLSMRSSDTALALKNAKNVEIVYFEGPHPAGNVGVQINQIEPVNKGETVWTINYIDILIIGRLFNRGISDFTRLVALTGSEVEETGYYRALPGARILKAVKDNTTTGKELRYISGNVLTGKKIAQDGFLGFYHDQITVIPEGKENHEFFGWITPGFNKFSVSRTYFTWLFNKISHREYVLDARIKGGKRAMIMSDEYDKVFPMDIYPEFLLRAIIAFNIDKMENLGVYEVAPEDFALCEFVDTSKIEIQKIVRTGLDLLYKEMN